MLAIEQRYWRGVRVVGASIIADSVLGQSLGKPQRDFGGLAPTLISEKQRETENGSRRSRKTARQLKPFQPGVSGNPNGRPAGGRTVFSQGFLKDLASVWPEEGRETMVKTARTNPAVFFATCARLIPNDVRVTVQQQLPGNLSAEDWAMMREIVEAVKQAIVAAASVDFQTSTGTTP